MKNESTAVPLQQIVQTNGGCLLCSSLLVIINWYSYHQFKCKVLDFSFCRLCRFGDWFIHLNLLHFITLLTFLFSCCLLFAFHSIQNMSSSGKDEC